MLLIHEPVSETASLESAAEQITSRGARQGQRIHSSTHSASTVALGDDYVSTSQAKSLERSHPSRGVRHGRAMHRLAAKNVDEKHNENRAPNPDTGALAAPLSSSINSTRYSRGARHGQAIQQAAQAPLKDVSSVKTSNSVKYPSNIVKTSSHSGRDLTSPTTTLTASPSTIKKGTLRVTNGLDHDNASEHQAPGNTLASAQDSSRPASVATEAGRTPEVFKKKRSLASLNGRVRIRDSIEATHLREMKKRTSEEVSTVVEVIDVEDRAGE